MRSVGMITGASRGLGATLAAFLAAQNFDLVLTARGADALERTATAVRHYGGRVTSLAGDIAVPAHRAEMMKAVEEFGGLDLLVNNASDLGPTPLPQLSEYPLDALRSVLDTNVVAPLALIQAALPLLERRGGLVANISSDAALGGYPGWGGYGASRAALDLVSLTLAQEMKDRGIGVVSIDPGDMRTAMHQAAFAGEDISDRPLPEVTLPFWAWLLGQERRHVNGRRFVAQSDRWELAA